MNMDDLNNTLQRICAAADTVRVPASHDLVYKDECMFSFDTPESPTGLFTSLTTWQSFGFDYLELDFERNRYPLYLLQVWYRIAKPSHHEPGPLDGAGNASAEVPENSLPSRLAIGVEGGFDVDKKSFEVLKKAFVVAMPHRDQVIAIDCPDLPNVVKSAVNAILLHDGFSKTSAITAAWEEEERKVSKYAENLVQLESGKKVSPDPSHWRCEESGMSENLWLNLSTGYIGSGRKNWDLTGGTGAALKHYEETGRNYPLVVKLGTITPHGADVYSYAPDEDDMVVDPKLAEHLAHWGINMQLQRKTEKTMAELQIDLNASYEFDKITESGSSLTPLAGPGYIGLENLGNSCYMNCIVQLMCTVPLFVRRYFDNAHQIFKGAPQDPAGDLIAMTSKLAVGLLSDRYARPIRILSSQDEIEPIIVTQKKKKESVSKIPYAPSSVRPFMFKTIVGKGHQEFRTGRQQDAGEFFQYLLECFERVERGELHRVSDGRGTSSSNSQVLLTSSLFSFSVEDRYLCNQSKKVRYTSRTENMLSLPIPLHAASNKHLVDEFEQHQLKKQKLQGSAHNINPVKLDVPFAACVEQFSTTEEISDFLSSATGVRGTAQKRSRIRSFPEFLMIQMRRYYLASDWTPKKLDVCVSVPEELNIEFLRSAGPQPGEELLPEDDNADPASGSAGISGGQAASSTIPDNTIVAQVMAMGFSENAAKRAARATANAGVEECMEWVFAHMEDEGFNDPLENASASVEETTPVQRSAFDVVTKESVDYLCGMGFTTEQASAALKVSKGSVEHAADWLLNHVEDLDAQVDAINNVPSTMTQPHGGESDGAVVETSPDGEGKYELVGFASHMGSNTSCGHYVAHIKKEGKFVLFNDDKVAMSQDPPLGFGFLYLFRRKC